MMPRGGRRWAVGAALVVLGIGRGAAAQPAEPTPPGGVPAPTPTPAPAAVPAALPAETVSEPSAPPPATGAASQTASLPSLPSLPETGSDADAPFKLDDGGDLTLEEAPKLELYGFADFNYTHLLGPKDNEWRQFWNEYPSMFVGHLNLYMASTLSENWRSLAEVRFTYAPLGDENSTSPDGSFTSPDNLAADYAEVQRNINWGGIEIQRAWLEYQPLDFLTIRAGQWLTPYGYWNDDHGSPAIIGVLKPFTINEQLFPERQTGLVAYGKLFIGASALGYAVTLSNGRGPFDAIRDLDANKAIGGRLYLETNAVGNLTVGVNAYRGRYTASSKHYRVELEEGGVPSVEIYRTITASYQELSLGADAKLLWKGLHVQGEFMMNEAAYDDNNRPQTVGFDPTPTFIADYRRIGAYLLVGYRLPWLTLMPYAMAQHNTFTNSDAVGPVTCWTGGLNVRPTPNVVLKAELGIARFSGRGSTGLGDDLPEFGAQIAWAF
jgi:hypothetical protein